MIWLWALGGFALMSGATGALVCVMFTVGKRGAVPEEQMVDDEAQMRALAGEARSRRAPRCGNSQTEADAAA